MIPFNYKTSFFTLVLLAPLSLLAQQKDSATFKRHNLYGSADASAWGGITLNYELPLGSTVLKLSGHSMTWSGYVNLRAGYGLESPQVVHGPGGGIALSGMTGKGNHHFEISGGVFRMIDSDRWDWVLMPIADLGYRYQKPTGGFLFRARVANVGIGISLGHSF